jgi:PIN domain
MTESNAPQAAATERAFLDANVIRGQLTNDILLSVAAQDVVEPRWSQDVIDEMRRNRPDGVSEQAIDRRIGQMNRFFPRALTSGYEGLTPQMPADPKDQHVLAAAVHSRCDVLVSDNTKDFDPPSTGPRAMRVERLSQFLNRKLTEQPDRVQTALRDMVGRNRRAPQSMSQLIDELAEMPELRAFARKLNAVVRADQQGTSEVLTADQRRTAESVALDGVADARGATENSPSASNSESSRRPRGADRDRENPER